MLRGVWGIGGKGVSRAGRLDKSVSSHKQGRPVPPDHLLRQPRAWGQMLGPCLADPEPPAAGRALPPPCGQHAVTLLGGMGWGVERGPGPPPFPPHWGEGGWRWHYIFFVFYAYLAIWDVWKYPARGPT